MKIKTIIIGILRFFIGTKKPTEFDILIERTKDGLGKLKEKRNEFLQKIIEARYDNSSTSRFAELRGQLRELQEEKTELFAEVGKAVLRQQGYDC